MAYLDMTLSQIHQILILDGCQQGDIDQMKGSEYHFELNPICRNLLECIETSTAKSEDIEFEIKQAQVKKCFDSSVLKKLEFTSMEHPTIISAYEYRSKMRVNAKCESELFDNASKMLENLRDKIDYPIKEEHYLYFNFGDTERYVYTGKHEWFKERKVTLFRFNYDVTVQIK